MLKKLKIFSSVLILIIFIACSNNKEFEKKLKSPIRVLKNYNFDNNSALISRIRTKPDFVLTYLRKLDNRKDYTIYTPTKKELKTIKRVLKIIPPLQKKILQDRLIAIYFVNNFLSSGYSEWAMDENNNIFAFIVFNTQVLKNNISQLITAKENTCFIDDDPSYNIQIDCGNKYNSFLYILTHEATHVVDYVKNITRFIEPIFKNYYNNKNKVYQFTDGVWKNYFTPIDKYDFKGRNLISFYGFNGGAKIKISEAVMIYSNLMETPFVSLYGSLNWAEDLAEFVTYYHLTQKLNLPYSIKIYKANKLIFKFEPMKSPIVQNRFKTIQMFYNE